MSKIGLSLVLGFVTVAFAFPYSAWSIQDTDSGSFSKAFWKDQNTLDTPNQLILAELKKIKLEPAVRVTYFHAPSVAFPGQDLTGSCKVVLRNVGNVEAKNFDVDLVLSNDPTVRGPVGYSPNYQDDVLLEGGRVRVESVKPGEMVELSGRLMLGAGIPSDTPPGDYFIVVLLDSNGVMGKPTQTAQNIEIRRPVSTPRLPLRPMVDLQLTIFWADKTEVSQGETLTANCDLRMMGSGSLPMFNMEIYLVEIGTDQYRRSRRISLAKWRPHAGTIDHLQDNEDVRLIRHVFIPEDLQPGRYNLCVRADSNNHVAETDEKNVKTYMISVKPKPPTAIRRQPRPPTVVVPR